MNPRRIARLQEHIKHRIAEVLQRDLADPRHGLITITRVEVDKEFTTCKAWWSSLGGESDRAADARFLRRATPYIQRALGEALNTRTVPRLTFHHDESIAGAIRMQGLLAELRQEREERRGPDAERGAGSDPEA